MADRLIMNKKERDRKGHFGTNRGEEYQQKGRQKTFADQ